MSALSSLLAKAEPLGPVEGIGGYVPTQTIDSSGSSARIEMLISNVVGFLTITAGLAFLIYFAIGGLTWITSGGDKGKVETAKSYMTNAAIGMIVIVSAWAITWIVGTARASNF